MLKELGSLELHYKAAAKEEKSMPKDLLMSFYRDKFKEILLPLGFKIKGQGFFRVVNGEVIQAVRIQRHRLLRKFTINFNFAVLCMRVEPSLLAKEDIRLPMFLYGDDCWWDFDNNNLNSIEQVVSHVVNEFKKVLYLFYDIVDTKSYYENIFDIERRIYGNRLTWSGKIELCLKLKKFDEVLNYIKYEEEYENEWLKERISFCKNKDEELKFIKMSEEDFFPLKKIREAILNQDFAYLDEAIKNNEEVTKRNCREYLKIEI